MAQPRSPRAAPVWGIFLIFLGIVFLLQTFGVISWGVWATLWRFWPALIIVIGLSLILRRVNPWLVSLLIIAILGGSLGLALWQEGRPPLGVGTTSYSQPITDLQRARIDVDFAAGSLILGSLPADSLNLVGVESQMRGKDPGITADFDRQNDEGRVALRIQPFRGGSREGSDLRWLLKLTRNIPLVINVDAAASNAVLDMSDLKATEIDLDINAARLEATLPSSGVVRATVKANASAVEIIIPKGVAAEIRGKANLGVLDIATSRFPKKGDTYISDNFSTSENQVYLEIDANVGKVVVK